MASKTKRTKAIRKRKSSPNKVNMKKEQQRVRRSLQVIEKVAQES